jgi:DNA-binding LacI/PurR family transcriptional regulator
MHSRDRAPSVTQADVAARAGVSQALVSIVFRNAPGASPGTRERVLKAAAELEYRPDHRARLLAGNRSRAIGVSFLVGHEFHAELVEHLYDAAAVHEYELVLGGVTGTHSEAEVVRSLMGFRCEALILLAPSSSVRELEAMAGHEPVIVTARAVRSSMIDVVRADDFAGARLATERLIELGHRDIVHVHGARASGATERRAGYKSAMRAAGLEGNIDLVAGGLVDADGERAADAILQRPSCPTAVVAFNDHCAAGVLATFRGAGLRVPGDVSIVGFDNAGVAKLATVRLTTVDQNVQELARRAMERAIARINGDEPTESVIEPTMVERQTAGIPPRRPRSSAAATDIQDGQLASPRA